MLKVLSHIQMDIQNQKNGVFTVSNAMKKINKEFDKNHNVIIDIRELEPEHVEILKKAIEEAGVFDRIIWHP